jgi:hypothetical protein
MRTLYNLKGLTASSPIGFMAALGMLRVLASDRGCEIRLGWRNGHAVIDGIDPKSAISELTTNMDNRAKATEFNWADSPRKVTPEKFRLACQEMKGDKRALGFMAGWASDAVLRQGAVAVTRMDMTSGQQKLIRDLRKLAEKITPNHFESALFGGTYEDQPSFGLDPVAVRSHAHEHQAPTKSKAPGKPGLVWLAFESIPAHPVVPISANKTQTTGWRLGKDVSYVWPIWDGCLTLEEVWLLRSFPLDSLSNRPDILEVWSSRYGSSGKYGMLLPAQRER